MVGSALDWIHNEPSYEEKETSQSALQKYIYWK